MINETLEDLPVWVDCVEDGVLCGHRWVLCPWCVCEGVGDGDGGALGDGPVEYVWHHGWDGWRGEGREVVVGVDLWGGCGKMVGKKGAVWV